MPLAQGWSAETACGVGMGVGADRGVEVGEGVMIDASVALGAEGGAIVWDVVVAGTAVGVDVGT